MVDFHPEAIAEARAAREWYQERSVAAAERFAAELDQAVERIDEFPELWPRGSHGTRHYLLHHFPYHVVYRILDDRIEVVAVAHAHRRPGYWRRR